MGSGPLVQVLEPWDLGFRVQDLRVAGMSIALNSRISVLGLRALGKVGGLSEA